MFFLRRFMSILLAIGFLVGFIGSACLPVLADTIEIPITGEWRVPAPPPSPEINFAAVATPVDLSMDIGVTDISVSRTITNYSVSSKLIFSIASAEDTLLRVNDATGFDNNSWIHVIFNTPSTNGGYYTNLLGVWNRLLWYGGVLQNNTMNLIQYPPNLPYGAVTGDLGAIGAANNMIIIFEAHRKADCKASLSGTLRFTVRGELYIQP